MANKKDLPEIKVSIDGEFTGPIPPFYSMISMGAVAYHEGREISRFKVNLKELPEALRGWSAEDRKAFLHWHPDQRHWWGERPVALAAALKDPLPPWKAMGLFDKWLRSLPGKPKLLGWPLPVDFMWFFWYYWRYLKRMPPFGFDGIDIKSYFMGKFKLKNLSEVKHSVVKKTVGMPDIELPHIPDLDSEDQAEMFHRIEALP